MEFTKLVEVEEPPSKKITKRQWNDWHWQLRNSIDSQEKLSKVISLLPEEQKAFNGKNIPLLITPYYASVIKNSPQLRKTVVPNYNEFIYSPEEKLDPLNEDDDSPIHGIVHRYPDRILFLVTNFCSTNCRYCTRSRVISDKEKYSLNNWKEAINYISEHKEIRDVLISGGDPLTLSDEKLEWLLQQLTSIPHIEIVRIGTKVPVVIPQRVTKKLCNMLKKYRPLWMNIHFTHPDEITKETSKACEMLSGVGIPLGSQSVLLEGVNNNSEILKSLFQKLLKIGCRPYYLYQCDPILGSSHFRTSVQDGIDIIRNLRGHTTGLAIPSFVIDAPGGGGKIPMSPDYVVGYEDNKLILKNYEEKTFIYDDVKRR